MKIVDSQVNLQSTHSMTWRQEIRLERHENFGQILAASETATETEPEMTRVRRLLADLLEAILAALTGRKCRDGELAIVPAERPSPVRERTVRWQLDATEIESESESTSVQGAGWVKTADGKTLAFDYDIRMQSAYVREQKSSQQGEYALHDPLVINFGGGAAELTDLGFAFDLNADGKTERLPGLGNQSGFIALDRNGNGRIDVGTELFGARSGDGFGDLAAYDDDHNGWIDENDAVFSRLSVWRGGTPPDRLESLNHAGVGAICLKRTESPYVVRNDSHELLGEIRASGVWLRQDGLAGSLMQIDLATRPSDDEGRQPEAASP